MLLLFFYEIRTSKWIYVSKFATGITTNRNAMPPIGQIAYTLKKKDIQEEVYKRTSYLGKNRPTEASAYTVEQLSFTKDEQPLFDSHLVTVGTRVFEEMGNFTHNLPNAFVITDRKAEPMVSVRRYGSVEQIATTIQTALENAVSNGDMLEVSIPAVENYPYAGTTARVELDMDFEYEDFMGIARVKSIHTDFMIVPSENNVRYIKLGLDLTTGDRMWRNERYLRLLSSDVETEVVDATSNYVVHRGAIVRITEDDGSSANYVAKRSGIIRKLLKEEGSFEIIDKDNDVVVFKTWKFDWFNENYIIPVRSSIFDALVHGICAKWLEDTLPSEAERFQRVYEQNITDMKNRLNAQKKPVRRHYNLF